MNHAILIVQQGSEADEFEVCWLCHPIILNQLNHEQFIINFIGF